jgi:hypothetical protein
MDEYIDLLALAILLHCAPQTVINNRARAPWRVPPCCTPPGTRRLLWRRADVDAWLAGHVQPAAQPPRRPGRPRKAVRHG